MLSKTAHICSKTLDQYFAIEELSYICNFAVDAAAVGDAVGFAAADDDDDCHPLMERKEHSGVHFLVQWCSYPLVVFDSSAP